MSCTRLLPFLNPCPIMPVDMAVRICLASSPPLCSFVGKYDDFCSPSAGTEISSRLRRRKKKKTKKKSVVFADSRGLELAVVHVFNQAEDVAQTELQFHLLEIEGATAALHLGGNTDPADCSSDLVLDFTQPAADYLDLRNRLKVQQVCLETCSVRDRRLSGTVQVRNICSHKLVSMRVTFDSWSSFQDVQCHFLNNVYSCQDTESFSFSVLLPERSASVEFCFQYRTRDRTYWDNNHGINYRLVERRGEQRQDLGCDPYGSPRTAGIFPEWQSLGRVDTGAPYW